MVQCAKLGKETPVDPKARKFLEEEMEKFLFTDEAAPPPDFVPPES